MKEIIGKIFGIIVIIFFGLIIFKVLDGALDKLSSPSRYSPDDFYPEEMPFP